MEEKVILKMLEEAMEIDEGTLDPMDILEDMSEWDSLSRLSFVSVVKSTIGKSISIKDIGQFVVVQDVIDYFQGE